MKRCEEVRGMLLEADPAELRGEGDGPTAAHVRACAECARLAGHVLEEYAVLDRHLSPTPELDVAALIARARLEPVEGAGPRRLSRWQATRRGAAVLAVAAAAALLITRPAPPPDPGMVLASPLPGAPPLVEPPADRNVAVIATDDPDITVLWFF